MSLIASLRNILKDAAPQPMRQIEGPLKIGPDRLHNVVEAASGWTGPHPDGLCASRAGWAVPDPDGFQDGPMPGQKTTPQKTIEDTGARTIQ